METVNPETAENAGEWDRRYRMCLGHDLRYHFEDPELRRKGGDDYVFDGKEPGMEGRFRPEMN